MFWWITFSCFFFIPIKIMDIVLINIHLYRHAFILKGNLYYKLIILSQIKDLTSGNTALVLLTPVLDQHIWVYFVYTRTNEIEFYYLVFL